MKAKVLAETTVKISRVSGKHKLVYFMVILIFFFPATVPDVGDDVYLHE